MGGQRSVLIVDQSEENRVVLQTALERRGLRIYAAGRARPGLELAQRHHPDLIVLDLESEESGRESLIAPFTEQSRNEGTPLVLLGTASGSRRRSPDSEFVSKPYHYGPLVHKIEKLLDTSARPVARCA